MLRVSKGLFVSTPFLLLLKALWPPACVRTFHFPTLVIGMLLLLSLRFATFYLLTYLFFNMNAFLFNQRNGWVGIKIYGFKNVISVSDFKMRLNIFMDVKILITISGSLNNFNKASLKSAWIRRSTH